VFARVSWNDGRNEDIAYADIDRSIAAGVSVKGSGWSRPNDVVGLAGASGGLSPSHRAYLARGGTGFILGDGALDYGSEEVVEAYYSLALPGRLAISPDWQYLEHPGYNRDRGGFSVYAVRGHVAF
jgi:high affinity Mn2+ porin